MTQCDLVVEYMKRHGSITDTDARDHLHCSRLSGRIDNLKKKGYVIGRQLEDHINALTGHKSHHARYWIIEEPKQETVSEMMARLLEMAKTPITEAHNG